MNKIDRQVTVYLAWYLLESVSLQNIVWIIINGFVNTDTNENYSYNNAHTQNK